MPSFFKENCGFFARNQWRIQDFREVGATNPPDRDSKFSQKLDEIEIIWTLKGTCIPHTPSLDLSLVITKIFGENCGLLDYKKTIHLD